MRTIWKYTLAPTYKQTVDIPTGFKVRHVASPSPTAHTLMGVCVWVEVDESNDFVPVDFYMTGTGHSLPHGVGAVYVGTAVMGDGYEWHVHLSVPGVKGL
jgi:hypothetical protein